MAATMHGSTSSLSSIQSDNSDADVKLKGVAGAANKPKNYRRTRDALGEIGNRLVKKGPMGNVVKGSSAVNADPPSMKKVFAVPQAPVPRASRNDAKKAQFASSQSSKNLALNNNNAKPRVIYDKTVKPKVDTNLKRNQSAVQKALVMNGLAGVTKHSGTSGKLISKQKPQYAPSIEEVTLKTEGIKISSKQKSQKDELIKAEAKNDTVIAVDKAAGDTLKTMEFEPIPTVIEEDETKVKVNVNKVEDIDLGDKENPLFFPDYITDIFHYLFKLEMKYPVEKEYMQGRSVNSKMRTVLIDWLVDVHFQFGFTQETLFLAIRLMDLYLQIDKTIERKQLQLVGITALFLAAKYEEVVTPTIWDFSNVCDGAYCTDAVRSMEHKMLKVLRFDFAMPSPVMFLRRISKAAGSFVSNPIRVHSMAKYIMELSLVDYSVVHLYPSQQAAGSLALSMFILERKSLEELWTPTLVHYSNISLKKLKPIISMMVEMLCHAIDKPTAVSKKYHRRRFACISESPELDIELWKSRIVKEVA